MIREQLKEAKKACRFMQNVKPEVKNKALKNISEALIQKSELIIQENQKDIAEAYGIKGPSVTSLIKTMEKNGFITRVKNKNDARSYDVFLTEKGEEVFHQVKKAFFEYDGEFSKKLSDEDKKEFLRLMKIVTENPPPDSMKIDR